VVVAFSVDRGWLPPVFSAAAVGIGVLGFLVSRRVQARAPVAARA
jgi:hypothetical protein